MRCTRLELKHYPLVQGILEKRAKVGKYKLSDLDLEEAIEKLYSSAHNKKIIMHGAFDGETLISYLVQLLPTEGSFWNMVFLGTDPAAGAWDYRTNGMDSLWLAAFATGELKRVPGVVWSLPKAWANSYERTLKRSTVWPMYSIQTYREIPANTFPTNKNDAWVFGTKPKTYDVLLRSAWPKRLTPGQ